MECLVVSIFTAPRCPCDPTERRDHHPPVSIFKASRCPWVMVRPILSRSSQRRDAPATASTTSPVPVHGGVSIFMVPRCPCDAINLPITMAAVTTSRSSRRRDAPATGGRARPPSQARPVSIFTAPRCPCDVPQAK